MNAKQTDKAIGKRFAALRKSRGIRQNFIADKLGISTSYLCELESGKKRWFAELVKRYEGVLL